MRLVRKRASLLGVGVVLVGGPRGRVGGEGGTLQVIAEEEGENVDTVEVGEGFGGGGVDCRAVSCTLEIREEVDERRWWDGGVRCKRGKVFDI